MQNDLLISRNKNSYRKKFGASFFAAILVLTAMTTISVFSAEATANECCPPVADAANGPYFGYTGEAITLDGSGSYDTDGYIVSWEWGLDFDGEYDDATGETTSHTWSSPGNYQIGLEVTDDDGYTDTDTADVLITDDTPPIQTFEVGNPNITRTWLGNEYYVIGPCTPLWINSTDDESGSDRIEYSVWLANDLNQSPIIWTELPQYHSIVYDEDDGDEDGVVHAEFYLDETCLHEIRYQCWDEEGNTEGVFSTDLFVDKCTPVIVKEVGIPQYGVGVIQPPWASLQTPLTFTTYDRCCLPGGTGVKSLTIKVWWKENTCDDSGALNVIETIYVEDGDANDTDPREGFVGYEFHFKQSGWYELEYWAEDIMCNIGSHVKQQHRVDTDPPKITKTHPDHGYLRINDTYGYLKCDVPITLEAEDMPDDTCNVGLAGMFWRYEFNVTSYPLTGEGGAVNGADIALQYNFSDPEIEDYWWYNYTDDIRFFEECQHDLYYFAIDNIGNYEAHHQVYYVDDTEPYVEVEYPDHGYYEDAVDHLKIDTPITLAAYDNPDDLCQADIESIFYRYEWNSLMFPSGPGTGIVHGTELVSLYGEDYNIPEITDYYWYRVDDDTVDISFLEECQHDLIFFAKDNVCHRSELYYLTFYVDGQAPELDIMYPEHGYYSDDVEHLKCNTTITLKASDLPENECSAGIESIFWRYEYDGGYFPDDSGTGIIDGYDLYLLYGNDYNYPEITEYYWYYVDADEVEIWFEEECYHELFWFAKDNVCQRTEIWYSEYYVDDTGPWAEIEFSEEHGYYQDDDDRDHIKCGVEFSINAYDLPDNECWAGIESIFYRYEWNLTMFPSGPGTGIVNGADLVGLYGEDYNIPEITDYYWYRVDDNTVDISFLEECQHDLFFFAKDNVCHRSEIYDRTIYVDCTEPDVWLELPPGHGYYPIDETSGYIREETQFTIKAEDFPENDCAVGIESIFFRYEWDDDYFPDGPGPYVISGDELGIMYGYTDPAILDYWWYYTDSDNISLDFYEQCQHDFYYWAKDNVCHRTDIYEHTFYVDDMAPMVDDYPPMVNHGLYIDGEDIHLKCGLPIYISAMDLPRDSDCDSGIESIFWRYEWDDQMFPLEGEENAINGTALVDLYGDSYDIPEITDYWWYLVDDILVEIIFAEECEHTIYYFAKDNVCHRTDVYDNTYYIDCSGPEMDMDLPEHGYMEITETSGSLKGGESVYLNAYDLPDNDCAAGIESIFWRYEWENTSYPVGYDPGIVSGWDLVAAYGEAYNISEITDYYWYRVDADYASVEFWENCQHDLFFFAKDNVCNRGIIYHHTFFVDYDAPGLEVVYPDHGYYEESFDFPLPPIRHLKCYTPITINAFDFPENDCATGIESIFWRYEFEGEYYPPGPGDGVISGEQLYILYGSQYLDPAIYDYYWYRVDDDTVEITFEEECQHDLYFFAKDNVCHPSWIWMQTYYVDNTDPDVDIFFPEHGYYPVDENAGYLKCFTPITLDPYDLPENECQAGIEALFYRYEYNGGYYPSEAGTGVISGPELATLYGYTESEIINYWWYYNNASTTQIEFTEECIHELYFWAKDNVCHHSDIYHWTFYVDSTPPLLELDLPEHGYYEVDEGIGHLKCYTPFWINATDFGECQAGIESIFWRYEYDGDFYPDEPGMGVISGNELAQLYGYTDPNITEFWWYFVNSTSVELMFEEECQHDLYWFAKDNVCHPTDVFHHTFLVDNSDPEAYIIPLEGHGYYGGDVEFLKCDMPISISAYDLPENECMAGVESIFYRYEWNDLFFPDGPGTGIVSGIELVGLYGDDYDIPDITGYFWYRVDDGSVDITFMEECEHELFYFVKDNVCHRSSIYDESYYVDCSGPEIDITHPDHGYIEIDEASGYLKAGISINLEAFDKPDNDCATGIESIFWRYEWDNTSYPIGYDPGIVSGWDLVMWYGEDYNISDITDYFWYRVDDNTVDISFFEECQHDLFFFAKDNVCNRGPIYHRTYFVDDSEPELTKTHPEDGYAYINEKNYIKCDTPITITATDDGDCQAGVESIFWRYEFDGEYFPSEPGAGVVSGDDLVAAYGDDYYDDSIYFYLWYRVDSDSVEIRFYEDCIHDLFYFAKDNVCHPTDVHHQTYYVDCTPPETTKDVEGPTCIADEDDIEEFGLEGDEISFFWIRDNDTLIILNSEDYEEPCASGIDYIHIELWWDENNDVIFDEDELLWEQNINETPFEFKIYEDCLHKIVWYAVDLVGNVEEPHVQYHRVDSTPPESVKTFNGPTYPAEDYPNEMYGPDLGEHYWVTSDTEVNLTAVDQTWPCASGVIGFHVEVEWDPDCDGVFDIQLLDEDIPSSPYSVIFTFKELVDDYYGYDVDCYEGEYKITWSSYDCLYNTEEEKIQYHRVDDTPPHVVILKPVDGWYSDGECIPAVVFSEDLNSPHCGYEQCGTVGIEDDKQGFAYLIDIFPEFKIVELDSTNFLYDADSHEFIGNVCIPEESGITDGIVIFVAGVEDNLGNDWDSIREMIHAIVIQALAECMDESCCMEIIADLWADFVIDQNLVFIGIDNTPPEVEILETQVELGTIYVKANATDVLSGIVTGTPCYVTLGGVEIGTLPYDSTMGGCEGTLPTAGVPDGEQTLTVSVHDRAGCMGSDSVEVYVPDLPGPTTSGTDVTPASSEVGTELTVTATTFSTIALIADADFYVIDYWGATVLTDNLDPVDGDFDETSEDIITYIDTTGWEAGYYTIYVRGQDEHGRWGAYDEEEFSLADEYRPVVCNIIFPEDLDEFEVTCGQRYIEIIIDAYRPAYNGLPKDHEVTVKLYVTEVIGGTVITYNPTWDGEYFTVDIDIYKYQSNAEPAELILQAFAQDEHFNSASSFPINIFADTTVDYSIMFNPGWNGPINIAVQGCDDSVESVFASIDGYYEWVFEVGTWKNYHYGEGGNTLHVIEPDGWYWVKMNEAARFYVDSNPPALEITDPSEEYEERCEGPGTLNFETCELETWVTDVYTQIYDQNTGQYWNGTAWQSSPTWLECGLDDEDKNGYAEWYYDTEDIWTPGHTYNISAYAVDAGGCESEIDEAALHIYDPSIYVEKTVGEGLEELVISVNTEFTFSIYVENNGDLELNSIDVWDYLLYGITYMDSATVAYNDDPAQAHEPDFVDDNGDEMEYLWEVGPLAPTEYLVIEFSAIVTSCNVWEENIAEAYGYSICDDVFGTDDASVYGDECGEECIADKTWTTDADFAEGTMVGVYAENDQLQLEPGEATTYPVMWIANAGEDTLSKWDTNNNKELARYHTWFGPPGSHGAWSGPAPSRTCVDSDGNCYVANRHFDGLPTDVIKVYADDWIDRNGNGVLDTSYDISGNGEIEPGEMLPMTDSNGNNIIDPEEIVDERIAWAVTVGANNGVGRGLAIDLDGNIWVGLYNSGCYYKISSVDGSILSGPISTPGHTPYGALVDKDGILWGASLWAGNLLKLDTNTETVLNLYDTGYEYVYGIALGYDNQGNTHVYLGGATQTYCEFNSFTETFSYPAEMHYQTNGIATDSEGNIVAANSGGGGGCGKFAPDGSLIWFSSSQASGEYGTVVDSNDNAWAICRSTSKLAKYNGSDGAHLGVFNAGLYPYTYSDAAGIGYSGSTTTGKWAVIHDSQAAGTIWNTVSWNSYEPEGTSITVKVRSSEDQVSWSPWETTANSGDPLAATPDGRYVEIEVTMKITSGEESPILYDISIDGTCAGGEPEPSLEFFKIIDMPESGEVVEQEVGEKVRFWLKLHNTGDLNLTDIVIMDELPEGLTYDDVSGPTFSATGLDPGTVITTVDGDTLTFDFGSYELPPATWIHTYFFAYVDEVGEHENWANVTAFYTCCDYLWDEDNATVIGISEEPPEGLVHNIDTDEWFMEIQTAIDDPDTLDGHTIEVHDGFFFENVVVDKELTIQAASTPVVDAMGGTGFTIDAENVVIDGITIINSSYGVYCNQPAFTIQNNDISGTGDGIYFDVDNLGVDMVTGDSLIIGESIIYNNEISVDNYGIYFDPEYWGNNMEGDSFCDIGAFRITDNTISCTHGIYIYEITYFGYYMYDTSSFSFGGLYVNDNTITSSDDGIYVYWIGEFGEYMYNTSTFEMGDIQFNRNIINSDDYGMYLDYPFYDFGYGMYGDNTFIMGDFTCNGNDITSIDLGIYCYDIEYVGYEMYGSSTFTMGNLTFNDNIITSSTEDGLYIYYIEYFGYYMYDQSTFTMGDIQLNNNEIHCYDYGIYIYYIYCFGYYMGSGEADSPSFTMGNIEVNDNDITSSNAYGILTYYTPYDFGYEMYGTSSFIMGDITFNGNDITSKWEGMYIEYIYDLGYYMYDFSTFEMGNVECCDNTVVSIDDDGIYFGDVDELGYGVYDYSSFTMGDMLFNDNHVICDDYGMYIYLEYIGDDVYDDSTFTRGDTEVCNNTITNYDSSYEAMYLYFYSWGETVCDNAVYTMGDTLVNHNTITSADIGIYVYEIDDIGYDVDGNALFTMGNVEFCHNTINAQAEGIYFDYITEFGYDMHGNGEMTMDDFLVCDNTVTSGTTGLYFNEVNIGDGMYDNTIFTMGDFKVNNNDITSGDKGILFNDYGTLEFGYNMYGTSDFTMSNLEFNGNTIDSTYDGIWINWTGFGDYWYDSSTFTMGDLLIQENVIENFGHQGIELIDAEDSIVSLNTVQYGFDGIYLSGCNNNLIYNNYFNNTNNAWDDGTNDWNTVKTAGTNIIGGPYLGGNYYSDYSGADTGGDGLGETPYAIAGGSNQDNHPLTEVDFNTTQMGIIPSSYTVNAGDEFSATIYIDPTEAINGWEIYLLNFTQGLVNATLVTPGSEWGAVFFDPGDIHNDTGYIGEIQALKVSAYPDYNHTACVISFIALQPGICSFEVGPVDVTEAVGGLTIPVVTHTATITIT